MRSRPSRAGPTKPASRRSSSRRCGSARRSRGFSCSRPTRSARPNVTARRPARAGFRSSCYSHSPSASCRRCCSCSLARRCSRSSADHGTYAPGESPRSSPTSRRFARPASSVFSGAVNSSRRSARRCGSLRSRTRSTCSPGPPSPWVCSGSSRPCRSSSFRSGAASSRIASTVGACSSQRTSASRSYLSRSRSATQLDAATLPLLYVLTAVGAGIGALDQPARSALAPSLVQRRLIPAAMALTQTQWQLASVIGPAAAGLLIAQLGLASAYWIDVATFAGATVALLLMRVPRADLTVVHAPPLRALAEGIAFLWSRPLLLATMSVDFFATFFAVSRAVMPYFADRVFAVGPEGLGVLYAAPGVGAAVIALTSGWTAGVSRKGLGILVAVAVFGLAIAAFGFLPPTGFLFGLVLLAIAQGADTVSAIFRHTILQLETPDALRGRLSAINLVFVAGGPYLGQFESGVVAELLTPELSVITGGLACLGVVIATQGFVPQLARYRADLEALPASSG